jgi:predicted nucleic-acid-binding Zn-ribbon protein
MVKRYRAKAVEGRGRGKFGVISCHLCGGTEEYHAKSVRMIDLSDEVSTMNFQDTNQRRDIRSSGM